MARLNISIPDALYERLDRLRDRVNASKVCAAALEKELDMVEGPTLVADNVDTKVARLIERLRGEREKWYQRGVKAGEAWAIDVATLGELNEFKQTWSGVDHLDPLTADSGEMEGWQDQLPDTFTERDDTVWNAPLDDDPELRGAYVLGWYRGVRDLWNVARPLLKNRPG
ncbi:hypothetical protein [Actinopolymorpha sp. B9G3]|uniref:hypothetical protein n=1 Tax=Actinopolymorpha sp. B9G3 TaxID=3158970 RepID=UPI0032D8DC03